MPRVAVWDSGDRWDDPGLVWGPLATPPPIMSNDNRISAEITAANLALFLQKIAEARALFASFLVNLTPDEKRKLPTISNARAGMDADFLMAMTAHPELVPSYVSKAETDKDHNFRTALEQAVGPAAELCEAMTDTLHLAGSDSYRAYLSFYNSVQAAAQRNVPGADTLLGTLSPYFARPGRSAPPPTPHA